jgi:type II secretion system protein G
MAWQVTRVFKMSPLSTRGFTLIELLVVIAIIGILSSVVLASLSTARAKARDVRRTLDIRQVRTAMEEYNNDHGSYPPRRDGAGNALADNTGGYLGYTIQFDLAPYMSKVVHDPLLSGYAAGDYLYVRDINLQGYAIRIQYENTGFCKTGVNVLPGWWGVGTPLCNTVGH